MRVHGRFINISSNDDTNFPKLLPRESHKRLFHSDTAHTLSQLRWEYWIVQGRRAVYMVIKIARYAREMKVAFIEFQTCLHGHSNELHNLPLLLMLELII